MSNAVGTINNREWANCSQGEIGQMVRRLRTRRFLSAIRRDACILSTLFVAVFLGYFWFGVLPETQMDLGGIYCYQVQPLAEQLLTGQLDGDTRQKVERHLRSCEFCRKHVEQVRLEAQRSGPEGDRDSNWERMRDPQIVASLTRTKEYSSAAEALSSAN